jgi:hypothetical protein
MDLTTDEKYGLLANIFREGEYNDLTTIRTLTTTLPLCISESNCRKNGTGN